MQTGLGSLGKQVEIQPDLPGVGRARMSWKPSRAAGGPRFSLWQGKQLVWVKEKRKNARDSVESMVFQN